MTKKVLTFLTGIVFTMAVASAATYHVTLSQPATVNGTQLKAGDYKLQVEGSQAIFKIGKTTVEAPVKVQEADRKNYTDEVMYDGQNLLEIRIGGSHTRLLFGNTAAQQSSGS